MGVLSPTEYGAMDLQEPLKICGKVELLAQFGAKHLGNPCIDFFSQDAFAANFLQALWSMEHL